MNYPLSYFKVKKLQSFFMGKKCYEFGATDLNFKNNGRQNG